MANIFLNNKLNLKKLSDNLFTNKKIIALSILFTVVAVFVIGISCNKKTELDVGEFDNTFIENDKLSLFAANDGDIEITYNNAPAAEQKSARTSVSIEDTGRADPFLPAEDLVNLTEPTNIESLKPVSKPKPSYDLLPPPETITSDNTATEVMTTKVSGLMYDKKNPSAIININNSDYLVRKGDVVNDYKVLDITANSVTVKYGANVYKAGVGELFTGEGINYNTISNLENKFGGTNNSVNKK